MSRGRPKYISPENLLLIQKQSLDRYADIIHTYIQSFTDYISDYENHSEYNIFDTSEHLNELIYKSIKATLQLPKWELNWYIVILYYGADYIKELSYLIDKQDLKKLKLMIKKEIKRNLCNI